LKIADNLTNGRLELMGVDNACKVTANTLPIIGNRQKIIVLSEYDASQLGGTGEQLFVGRLGPSILKGGQHVDAAPSQPLGGRSTNVMIHVKRKAHGWFFNTLSFLASGVSPSRD
jgi:hypothetical protein